MVQEAKKIVEKFDKIGLHTTEEISQLRRSYKELTKEVTQDKNELYQQDIYENIDTCSSCLRLAVNQIRYIINKIKL